MYGRALPQKGGYEVIYEANRVSASKSHSYTAFDWLFLLGYDGYGASEGRPCIDIASRIVFDI
jgi:hypothetical protein